LLGAGGAGRVAALKFAEARAHELFLVNRTQSKADSLLAEIRTRFQKSNVSVGYPADEIDLVVNATSLGLKPDDPLPYESKSFPLKRARAAYDMIYRPAETPFLKAAKASGCRAANGLGMLLHQGAKAFELWTGQNPPIDIMRAALIKNVYGNPQS
jgi:shikimate dehydrogenase